MAVLDNGSGRERGRGVVWSLLSLYGLLHLIGVLLGDRLMALTGALGGVVLATTLWAMSRLAQDDGPAQHGPSVGPDDR